MVSRRQSVLKLIDDAGLNVSADFFEFIHHYVSDADIRWKDPVYRKTQDEVMRRFLDDYRAEQE